MQRTIRRKVRKGSGQDAIHIVATTTSGIAKNGLILLKERSISVVSPLVPLGYYPL